MKNISQDPKYRKPTKRGVGRAKRGEALLDLSKGRICSVCKIYKNRICFYEHPTGFNGLQPKCKKCCSLIGKSPKALQIKKKLYYKRKRTKCCVACGAQNIVNNVHCQVCWFKDKAGQRAGGRENVDAIIKLWNEQDGKCFYTGEKLIPGKNASLDHQDPRSKNGSNDVSNLRWVSLKVNLIKSNLNHEEFIDFCKGICDRFLK